MKLDEEFKIDLKGFHKQKGRYAVTREGYVFDKYLFRILSLTVVIIMLAAFVQLGGFKQYAYAACPADAISGFCDNPLYGACDLPACKEETLRPGQTIGQQPPSIATPLFFVFLSAAITFFINHLSQATKEYEVIRNERLKDNGKDKKRQRSTRAVPSRKR